MNMNRFLYFIIAFLGSSLAHSQDTVLDLVVLDTPGKKSQLVAIKQNRDGARTYRYADWLNLKQGRFVSAGGRSKFFASAYDVCDHPSGRQEIVMVHAQGLQKLGASSPFIREQSIFMFESENLIQRVRVCFALFSGKKLDFILPVWGGVKVFKQTKPGVFEQVVFLPLKGKMRFFGQFYRQTSPMQRVSVALEYPDIYVRDMNNDGLNDICMTRQRELICYFQNAKSIFSPEEGINIQFSTSQAEDDLLENIRKRIYLEDLNNDGYYDAIVSTSRLNLTAPYGQLEVFLNRGIGQFSSKADQIIRKNGYFDYHEFVDVDGDGDLDLFAPHKSLGWTAIGGAFLSREVDMNFYWYPFQQGRFSQEAVFINEVSFPIDFKNWRSFTNGLPVFRNNTKGLEITFFPSFQRVETYAMREGKMSDKPVQAISTPIGRLLRTADFDGDGTEDFVSVLNGSGNSKDKNSQSEEEILFIRN